MAADRPSGFAGAAGVGGLGKAAVQGGGFGKILKSATQLGTGPIGWATLGAGTIENGINMYMKWKAAKEQRKEDLRAEGINRTYKDAEIDREAGQDAWTRRVKENEIKYSRIMDFSNSLNNMFANSQNATKNIQQMLSTRR